MAGKTKTRKELEADYVTSMTACYTIASELKAKHDAEPPKVAKPPKVVPVPQEVVKAVTDVLEAWDATTDTKRTLDEAIVKVAGYKDANELATIYTSLQAMGVINYEKQKSAGKGATITLVK